MTDAIDRPDPGGLFMFGIKGTRPLRGEIELFRRSGASGVLVLGRNIDSPARLRSLIEGFEEKLGRRLIWAVDHEGGNVMRFTRGVTMFPGNGALGRLDDPRLALSVGRVMGRELGALGIGMNLAPVLDVLTGNYNPGIGLRSFGTDPSRAGALGAAFIRGIQESGVLACAKHFPGKGAARKDAHVELPFFRMSEAEFLRRHLPPFRAAVRAGISCVMSSHVVFPFWDSRPATFSRAIIQGVLRRRLGFQGAALTDDLCMGAVTGRLGVPQAALEAFEAGHDILMVSAYQGEWRDRLKSVELLREALARGRVGPERVRESLERVQKLLLPARASPWPYPLPLERRVSGERLAAKIATRALLRKGAWDPVREGRGLLVLFPDLRPLKGRIAFEGGPGALEILSRRAFRSFPGVRFIRVALESAAVSPAVAAAITKAARIICFTFEAMRFPGEGRLLDLLGREASSKTAVCLLRNPYDAALLKPGTAAVIPYGYHRVSLREALKALSGMKVLGWVAAGLLASAALPAGTLAQPTSAAAVAASSASAAVSGVHRLHDEFLAAVKGEDKARDLLQIEKSSPVSMQDVADLYDLFMRFKNPYVRAGVLQALSRVTRGNPRIGPLFLDYMKIDDPSSVFFGIRGALFADYRPALPAIRKIAMRPFAKPSPDLLSFPGQKDEWWDQYQALIVLTEWEGANAIPILEKKADEAPRVARIMGRYFWKRSLPVFMRWLRWPDSWSKTNREKALEGLQSDVPLPVLRETRNLMLKIVRDKGADRTVRIQLAVKVGQCSSAAQIAGLVADYRKEKNEETRNLYATAVFASARPEAVPLLEEFARKAPAPMSRAAALLELAELLPPPEFRKQLEWTAKNDPDPDNRQSAERDLRGLGENRVQKKAVLLDFSGLPPPSAASSGSQ